jgi:hypothetical protein
MRHRWLAPLALSVCGSVASAQAVNVTWKCAPPDPMNAIPVGDAAGHAFSIDQVKCTATKGSIGGAHSILLLHECTGAITVPK